MATLPLPPEDIAWLDEQVAAGRAASPEALLAELVARDREQAARQAAFDSAIAEGLASPSSGLTLDEIAARILGKRAAA
jgi:Arc/MetJ-type ribon-helix-helix transcriptional regulator